MSVAATTENEKKTPTMIPKVESGFMRKVDLENLHKAGKALKISDFKTKEIKWKQQQH